MKEKFRNIFWFFGIFAIIVMLFTFDMGSELQHPFVIGMIGAMVIGTAVSLFIIPLIYWYIYRKREEKHAAASNS